MFNMKFSYRVITSILFVSSVVVLYFYLNDDWINWHKKMKFESGSSAQSESSTKSVIRTLYESRMDSNISLGECVPMSHFKTDIDTYNILHQSVDKPYDSQNGQSLYNTKQENMEYEQKPSKLPLKIFLVPHSHNDPGWHKTVEGYFQDQTKPTLNNMVEKLLKFPNMTFVWAESVFLHMWYKDLNPDQQETVKRLVKRKQLEIVVGSWVVPDEANPHYFALVDQMIEGHQWLEKVMGIKPKNTWTLDPFGYSSTLPYLYKRAGFQNMIVLRVHEKLKEYLQKKKALEFFWRQHWDQDKSTDIFTQMMPYKLYNIKHTCGPDHSICLEFDFRSIPGEWSESRAEVITSSNVDRKAKLLLGQYQKKANLYRHNVVLVPLGDDFRFDRNIEWDQQYKNYMMLFNYINRKKEWNVEARFGTLQDYFDEVQKTVENNPELKKAGFPSLQGDFFPYTDEHNEYWTGYFSTRAYDKNYGREVEVHLRAAEILNSFALATSVQKDLPFREYSKNMEILPQARQNLALFQHHDAITGTARSYVVLDYEQRLRTALDITQNVIRNCAAYLMRAKSNKNRHSGLPFELDIDDAKSLKMLAPTKKIVDFSQNGDAEVILFNSIGHHREDLVELTVTSDRVEVTDENNNIVLSQINPIFTSNTDISAKFFKLMFFAKLPPFGLILYKLKTTNENPKENYAAYIRMYNAPGFMHPKHLRFNIMPASGDQITLDNDYYRARFSTRTGMMHSVSTKNKIVTTQMNMQYLMYKSRGSGAYIFNPAGPAVDTEMSTRPVVRVIKGPISSEIQMVQELVESTVRLCNTTGIQGQAFMIDNIADLRSKENKELVMRISSDMKHNNTFYTDLNAFHMMKRHRFSNLPPEANYYPMSAFAYLEDTEKRMTIISAQPLGVSCQEEGSLEIMLQRRLSYDDGRGLGEGVMDTKRAPSRFYMLIELRENQPDLHKPNFHEINPMPSILSHMLAQRLRNHVFNLLTPPTMLSSSLSNFNPVSKDLPCDVDLLNLRSIDIENSQNVPSAALLLHRVGFSCDFKMKNLPCMFSEGQVHLSDIFTGPLQLIDLWETTLSLMHNKSAAVLKKHSLSLQPMELYAFKTTFK